MPNINTNIIFAAPITSTNIKDNKLNKSLLTFINKERKKPGRILSNEGGYQTEDINLEHPTIKKFIKAITPAMHQHINYFDLKENKSFKVISLWFNINGKHHFNYDHCHMGGGIDFSAVYYITVPEKSGQIFFKNPDIGAHTNPMYLFSKREYNPFNQSFYYYNPIETQLLIFSSALEHRVKPNLNKAERISISFNARTV
jgi:uncharacterized protein (TIGR02466 family)